VISTSLSSPATERSRQVHLTGVQAGHAGAVDHADLGDHSLRGPGSEGARRLPAGVGVHALGQAVLQALRVARSGGRQLLVQPRQEEPAQQSRGAESDAGEDRRQQHHQPERQPPPQRPRPEPAHRSTGVMAWRP
jgi:hypothetical protein